jgi:tRNA dimethylallyltransferase
MADGIAITGPTASGKTDLAIEVALRVGGEIISMDSRQVYTGMDIGTAKASAAQRALVPHFGVDVLPPSERYNAGRFARDAREWIRQIRSREHAPVLVGGTGFFLRALTHPMFPEPPLEPQRKEALKRYLHRYSREELLEWLAALDAETAARLAREGGRQRLARAIEVALLTGRALSSWQREPAPDVPALKFCTFVLDLPRDVLYERINRRVTDMLEAGLVAEVRGLLAAGYDEEAPGMNATGYIELLSYVRGETALEVATEEIRTATRQFARRQVTWFRHQLGDALALDATRPIDELARDIAALWSRYGGES